MRRSLGEGELSTIPPARWPELRFGWTPATCVFSARCDLEALERCYLAQDRGAALALEPGEERVLVVGRRGHATYFRTLGGGEARAFQALWEGESFSVACVRSAAAGEQPAELVRCLRRWLGDGLIASIDG